MPATAVTVTGELNGAPRTADTVVTGLGHDRHGHGRHRLFGIERHPADDLATGQVRGTATFTLTPVNDDIDEPAETVTVEGSTTPTVGLAVTETTVTITDNDAAPTVTLVLSANPISENLGVSTVTATLSHPSSEDTTVEVSAAPVSPEVDPYFTQFGTLLTITAGETESSGSVTLEAADNDADEADKQVTVRGRVVENTHGVQSPNVGPVTVTITDDDPEPMVTLTLMPTSISEDGSESSTLTVTLSHPSSEATTVTVSAAPADAVTLSPNPLTIRAGETEGTVTLTAENNDIDGPETSDGDRSRQMADERPGGHGPDDQHNPDDCRRR